MDRNKNIKRSHASLSQFVKSENSNQESKRSKNNVSCELEINETVVAGTAFDNHLILKEIFGYLRPGDLRICCEVNKTWRTIADPMVFEYQIIWSRWRLPLVEVKTTKGYMVPEIQKRSSTIGIEKEFLQNLKRPAFIVMVLHFSNTRSTNESRDGRAFITRFGSLAYKLFLCDHSKSRVFRTDICFSIICKDFPNVEELTCFGNNITEFILRDPNVPLLRVQRFYFEPCCSIFEIGDPASRLLRLIPNVEEIHRVPMTMVKEFQDLGKLDVLRSVTFYRQNYGKVDLIARA